MNWISELTGVGAAARFTFESIVPRSHDGQTWIVTGGNRGLGFETARGLLRAGATVWIAARDQRKSLAAVNLLHAEFPASEGHLRLLALDLASLASVQHAAALFRASNTRLHGLVNNAGIMLTPYALTQDGIEEQFQVDYLGHFVLFQLLADLMLATARITNQPVRVVNLTSAAHLMIPWNPFWSYPTYESLEAINNPSFLRGSAYFYARAKLVMILFSKSINRKYRGEIKSIAVHPGVAATDLGNHLIGGRAFFHSFITISAQEGARNSLYAALSPELDSKNLWDNYLVPCAVPKVVYAPIDDQEPQDQLWTLSEALMKQKLAISK